MIKKTLIITTIMLLFLSIGSSAAASNTNNSCTNSQITQSASNVKNYVETQYALPSTVKVGNKTVTSSQFLYLETLATSNLGNGNTKNVTIKNVSVASNPKENLTSGKLSKTEYLSMASKINSYITINGKLPNYVTTSLGAMGYQSVVYMYSKILNYYNINKVLPSTVSVNSWYANTLGPSGQVNATYTLYKKLGSTSYGYVNLYKPYGTGKNKVAIIVGVHPQEVQTHIAMWNAISALSSKLKNVQIWVYQVVVTKDVSNYNQGRMNGQLLAQKYVVPDIVKKDYKLVVDTHGNRGNYYVNGKMVTNSMYAPSGGVKSTMYLNKILTNCNGTLQKYIIADGTSPKYVTLPITAKGIPALVYEQYSNQANYAKVLYLHALDVVKAVDATFA